MLRRLLLAFALVAGGGPHASAQAPPVDTSRLGPQVGARIPDFSGVDQAGRTQTLQSAAGPNGLMLVFFRSADW
ncbi:MAG: hypothetical protein AB1635_09980 [Acidobacteriota bacterium]